MQNGEKSIFLRFCFSTLEYERSPDCAMFCRQIEGSELDYMFFFSQSENGLFLELCIKGNETGTLKRIIYLRFKPILPQGF